MEEIWKPIDGHPGYSVSNCGRVQSRKRRGPPYGVGVVPHALSAQSDRKGYARVRLWDNGRASTALVHRLVLIAFRGECPAGMEASHLNGDSSDNREENLCWESRKANHARKVGHGTSQNGEGNSNAKLTNNDVARIVEMSKSKTNRSIAAVFGVSPSTIDGIISGKWWGGVTRALLREKGGA